MSKKVFAVLIASIMIAMVFTGVSMTATAKPVENHIQSVIYITNVWELQNMSNDLSGNYELANDIDASITSTWNYIEETGDIYFSSPNLYRGFKPIGDTSTPFTGIFNGNNYTINNLYIKWRSITIGLFGDISPDGIIINVGLENISVNSYIKIYTCGTGYMGSLVGRNRGYINNSYVTGFSYGGSYVGGFIGINNGIIYNSYSNVELIYYNYTGWGFYRGGFAGLNQPYYLDPEEPVYISGTGIIKYCYSLGNVYGSAVLGGFVGDNYGEISDSYSLCNVMANNIPNLTDPSIGGFAGRNLGFINNSYCSGIVIDYKYQTIKGFTTNTNFALKNYYDTDISGLIDEDGGIPKSTAEMMKQATFENSGTRSEGWDFDNIWGIDEDESYPYFLWQLNGEEGEGEEEIPELDPEPEETNQFGLITLTLIGLLPLIIIIILFRILIKSLNESFKRKKK